MVKFSHGKQNQSLKGEVMKANIRLILLGELILVAAIFLFMLIVGGAGLSSVFWFIDLPSIIVILLFLIPGLMIMGAGKDFVKAFSVGIRPYRLLELKNIIGAVGAAQKLTVFGALVAMIMGGVFIMGNLDDMSSLGPNLAVCFLTGFYAVLIEIFLLPLKLNAERKMNEEMDFEDE